MRAYYIETEVIRMSTKNLRREAAAKKARQKKMLIIAIGALAIVAIAIVIIVSIVGRNGDDDRVFAVGTNSVTLRADGTFMAVLPHNVRISGTYSEHIHGGVLTVHFRHDGQTSDGTIIDNVLRIPHEWEDGHGHAVEFTLQ